MKTIDKMVKKMVGKGKSDRIYNYRKKKQKMKQKMKRDMDCEWKD